MNPVLRVLLLGTKNPDSVWHLISSDVLRKIWSLVVAAYEAHINTTTVSCLSVATVRDWPKPTDISINMMPFVIGKEDTIPKKYRQYWPLITRCALFLDSCFNLKLNIGK